MPEEHAEPTTSRSSTRSKDSKNASAPNTPAASPPLLPQKSPARSQVPDNLPSLNQSQSQAQSASQPGPATSFSRPLTAQRPKGGARNASKGGGVQVILNSESDWSELAHKTATLPADALEGVIARESKGGSSGMLGFLNRKKGRERSPKPRDPGIIGKLGSRHILNG